MRAIILTIGDELLIGLILNTNAAWLGTELTRAGAEVVRTVAVGDDRTLLEIELRRARKDADFVITTGGLGPTDDDVTRDAVAAQAGVDLEFDSEVFAQISRRFERRGRNVPESNRRQAMVPRGFTVLQNKAGTAPGLWFEDEDGRTIAILPGVPHEMRKLFEEEVLPRLQARSDLSIIEQRTIRTIGLGESHLHERLESALSNRPQSLRVAFLPETSGVRIRLTATGRDRVEVESVLRNAVDAIRSRIESYIYSMEDEPIELVVGRMLADRGLTIAVAESCTGGHVAHQLTNVAGSSAYVTGGVVAYSNRTKREILEIPEEVLEREGAVSSEVAGLMAENVRRRFGTDIGISTTGIAGPSGGTPDKPVGTVWIGYSDSEGTETELLRLYEDRMMNKEVATALLFERVRKNLLSGRPRR